MNIAGTHYRTIWIDAQDALRIIDQRLLPHEMQTPILPDHAAVCEAIQDMAVRGAGLIGAAAGFGMWLAARDFSEQDDAKFEQHMKEAGDALMRTRPTAVNLAGAVKRMLAAMEKEISLEGKRKTARKTAQIIADEDANFCKQIGMHGLAVIQEIHEAKPGRPVQILTHCNAGWLAFVDHGSALAPVYAAHDAGIPVHVWVDETRPRNQGASLTAFELAAHGVPHSLIADNVGGHLMQHGMVDMVITGADRVSRGGDVANKIGTYLKALAARDNDLPFYVALPSSTFDFALSDGTRIPIEERHGDEVRLVRGALPDGSVTEVRICPASSPARNWAFDVTPARLVTRLITERGICKATEAAILALYPEHAAAPQDGVILFQADHKTESLTESQGEAPLDAPTRAQLDRLDACRTRLHMAGLIGIHLSGVGYGNLSLRLPDESILISGSGTGGQRVLGLEGYTLVEHCLPDENRVRSRGPVPPSSESMTHRAIYDGHAKQGAKVGCVVHAHHRELFEFLKKGDTPRTAADVTYGTPAMAHAVAELMRGLPELGVFITLGHPDGIFAFGPDPERVTEFLLSQNILEGTLCSAK